MWTRNETQARTLLAISRPLLTLVLRVGDSFSEETRTSIYRTVRVLAYRFFRVAFAVLRNEDVLKHIICTWIVFLQVCACSSTSTCVLALTYRRLLVNSRGA